MKIRTYIIFAVALIFGVFLLYWIQFYIVLDYKISEDAADWAQLGDYIGGVLNPLLGFISIVLLIKSLGLQYEANYNLKNQIKNSERTEKQRSFEILFFNLISSQKNLFDTFKVHVDAPGGEVSNLTGVKAVIQIENTIEEIKLEGGGNSEIIKFLTDIDDDDQIFGLTRAFYILVMIITDKLSDADGFSSEDRETHFKALINFTDFAQLRLVMISVQFLDYESTKYLRSSVEFGRVLNEVGLSYELY
jgi:hypothetical protein